MTMKVLICSDCTVLVHDNGQLILREEPRFYLGDAGLSWLMCKAYTRSNFLIRLNADDYCHGGAVEKKTKTDHARHKVTLFSSCQSKRTKRTSGG
jgi:hypothetical protein